MSEFLNVWNNIKCKHTINPFIRQYRPLSLIMTLMEMVNKCWSHLTTLWSTKLIWPLFRFCKHVMKTSSWKVNIQSFRLVCIMSDNPYSFFFTWIEHIFYWIDLTVRFLVDIVLAKKAKNCFWGRKL